MNKVIGFEVFIEHEGFANERLEFRVVMDKLEPVVKGFEHRNTLYRAQDNDRVQFYCYSGPSNGFCGREYNIEMMDGTKKVLKGPWSSRAGCINQEFHDKDAAIEVVSGHSFFAVTVKSLESLGAKVIPVISKHGEIRYSPDPSFYNIDSLRTMPKKVK